MRTSIGKPSTACLEPTILIFNLNKRRAHQNSEIKIRGKARSAEAALATAAAPEEMLVPTGEFMTPSPLLSLKVDNFKDGNRDRDTSSSSDTEPDDYEYDYATDSDGQGSICADSARGKVTDIRIGLID